MTPQLFPIVETISDYTAYRYKQLLLPDGRYTSFPMGLPGKLGDSFCHVPEGYTVELKEIHKYGSPY